MRLFRPRKRGEKRENSVELVRLRRAMEEPGCPICRLVRESEERRLWVLIYEHTGDPELHRRFSDSFGLCGRHAALLGRIVVQRPLATPAAVARLYETLCAHAREVVRSGFPRQRCDLCRYAAGTARRYAASLAEFLLSPERHGMYERSDGLCVPHLTLVLEEAADEVREFLRRDISARLIRLERHLRELQRKQRYDVHEGLSPAEANAWKEALWRFGGTEFGGLIVE
ncbi:hypothetical protein ACVNPS_02415 [Candidatus Bipolaricaulota sp. J31]